MCFHAAHMRKIFSTVDCGLAGSAIGLENVSTPFSHSIQRFMLRETPYHESRCRATRKLCALRADRSISSLPFLLTLELHCSVTQTPSPCIWRLYAVTGCMNVILLHLRSGRCLVPNFSETLSQNSFYWLLKPRRRSISAIDQV